MNTKYSTTLCLIGASLLSLSNAQVVVLEEGLTEADNATSSGSNYFLGGSYGKANDGAFNDGNLDALNVDYLGSVEFGMYYPRNDQFAIAVAIEFLFGSGDSSYVDGFESGSLDHEAFGLMVNFEGKYSFNKYVSVYAGAGIGFINSTLEYRDTFDDGFSSFTDSGDASESVFAYQFKAGIEVKPTEKIGIYAQYHYLSGSDFEDLDFTAISDSFIDLGVRYYF